MKVSNGFLTYNGSIQSAFEITDSIRTAFAKSGNEIPGILGNFLFHVEVALQEEGFLDADFEPVKKKDIQKNSIDTPKERKYNFHFIREIGNSRTGTLNTSYSDILDKIGKPNVTDLDDQDKVKASWGFESNGRKAFIWCYKHSNPKSCSTWSIDGDIKLIKEIFGEDEVLNL